MTDTSTPLTPDGRHAPDGTEVSRIAARAGTLRVWPAYWIVGVALASVIVIWQFAGGRGRQWQIIPTMIVGLLAAAGLLTWWVCFSRAARRQRLAVLAIAVVVVATTMSLVTVRGVTGDWVPILAFRWTRPPAPVESPVALVSAPQTGAAASTSGPALAPAVAPAAPASPAATATEAPASTVAPTAASHPAASAASSAAAPSAVPSVAPGAGSNVAASGASSSASTPASTVAAAPAPAAAATATVAAAATAPPAPRVPGDFPQFLGPGRNGILRGFRLARDFDAHPPRLLWRQPIGDGWAGFAIVGDLAITQEQRDQEERVVAYDLRTGRARWRHADRTRYQTFIAGIGPRATPSVADGRVFAMGATGILNALDLATGRLLWSHRVVEENGAEQPQWGKAGSPLVIGGRVIVSAGGAAGRSLVAYDAIGGAPIWAGGTGEASYSSPIIAELAGRRQIVIFNARTIAGHDPETGALLWEHDWPPGSPNVTTPVPLPGDRLLVSAGYGLGAKAYRLEAGADGALQVRVDWESPRLKSKFGNIVLHGGFAYGLDDGVLACLDPATGERKWKAGHYGHGQILLVEDLLLVQTEEGEIVLIEPSPDGLRELTRFVALDGKTWNPPALAGALLVVRNDREAAAYELPARR